MNKLKEHLGQCQQIINNICNMINIQKIPSNGINYNELYNVLYQLIPAIPEEYYVFRNRLRDQILPNLKTPDIVSINIYGQKLVTPQNGINPYYFGEVLSTIGS